MTNHAGWNLDNSYTRLPHFFYSPVSINPVPEPELVLLNEPLARKLGLNSESLLTQLSVFAGNETPENSLPIAQAYAGHQFGHFTMLGDGRAMLIGEQITPQNERFDIQLKGSGRTPYSRGGDGRAALGPMLREYIISEAMHGLGIPTTRSLAIATTGETILREKELPGAILTRVATSHLRVGTFEYALHWGSPSEIKDLADYAIHRHFPEVKTDGNPYLALLKEVITRQAFLIAKWQLVGFIHGVMNTDNMTISGESIDYGPCAFMDTYDPATVFSSIDTRGRYAYKNQPLIGQWNLARLAETLIPLLHEDQKQSIKIAEEAISQYTDLYEKYWLQGMRAKLGLLSEERADKSLINDLLRMMKDYQADYTNTFLALTFNTEDDSALFTSEDFAGWKKRWDVRRGGADKTASHQQMKDHNPAVIPRNHRVEAALHSAEKGDYGVLYRLLHVLSSPYMHSQEQKEYATLPPDGWCYQTFCGT